MNENRQIELPIAIKRIDAATFLYLNDSRDLLMSRNIKIPDALIEYVVSNPELGGIAQILIQDRGDEVTRINCAVKDEFWQSMILFDGTGEEGTQRRRREEAERREECEARASAFFETYREDMLREFPTIEGGEMPSKLSNDIQALMKIELDANGKGTDVGAAVEHLLSLQNNYACSVRWLNRREDREPHKTQTIEIEYAESGYDERYGQPYHRMLSRAHITIYPKPSGSHITFSYPNEHAQIYFPFWDDLYKLMGEWSILANTAPAPTPRRAPSRDEIIYQGRIELDRNRLFELVRDFVRDAKRVWSDPEDWRDFRAEWNTQESSILILASRDRTFGEYPIIEIFTTTAGQQALEIEIVSDAKGNRETAIALREYIVQLTAPRAEPSQDALKTGKAGRRTDAKFDQAFEMITNNTPQNAAREWYFNELGYAPDSQAIKNFNEAMRRRKNKQSSK